MNDPTGNAESRVGEVTPKSPHWSTLYDEDGEPYGELCHCSFDADHDPTDSDHVSDERRPCALTADETVVDLVLSTTELEASAGTSKPEAGSVESSTPIPAAAPAVWMDQRGNYWRVFPKGTLPGADEDTLSMCPTSSENYQSEPVAIYRQGRDLSAPQMEDLLTQIDRATYDDLLKRTAQNAWEAWTTGRDMVTEAELLMQMIAIRVGVEKAVPDA